DIPHPINKALALEKYLKSNYKYTLSPPHTPPDSDFADYFIFDLKEGYCTYFATAMAVMGRSVGLPTRYVEGFSMPSNTNGHSIYNVRNSNSHAWVEVYFPNVGWLPFDPTPPAYSAQIDSGQDIGLPLDLPNQIDPLDDHIDMPQTPNDLDDNTISKPLDDNILAENLKTFIPIMISILLGISLIALIIFIIVKIYIYRFNKLSYDKQ